MIHYYEYNYTSLEPVKIELTPTNTEPGNPDLNVVAPWCGFRQNSRNANGIDLVVIRTKVSGSFVISVSGASASTYTLLVKSLSVLTDTSTETENNQIHESASNFYSIFTVVSFCLIHFVNILL